MVILITGASRGLGRAIADAAPNAGHRVVATARCPEQLHDLAADHGDRVAAVALDVTDDAAANHAVQVAVDRFGRLDVVVTNAGYADLGSVELRWWRRELGRPFPARQPAAIVLPGRRAL